MGRMSILSALNSTFGASASRNVNGTRARALVAQGAQLVDVRSPEEYEFGHIDGAANIPVDTLGRRMGEIKKDRPVVLYCRSGARSSFAATQLIKAGYEVYDLGPMTAWGR